MKKPKALVLFSGGLDSLLTVKILQKQGIKVECVNFITPFSKETKPPFGLKLHKVRVGKEYFDMIMNPKHGYGSEINPCVDCKIYMLKKAKSLAKKINADFIATGEVLGQRPFSQRKNLLLRIEKEAGLKNKILRPLSAKLLKETEPEKQGLIKREKLSDIQGRSRKKQLKLAKEFGIKNIPSPGGGCLLTDPEFAKRVRDVLKNKETINWETAEVLKLGRHFRFQGTKIVVGRNEEENKKLFGLGKKLGAFILETKDYPGPVALVFLKSKNKSVLKKAAQLTASYSDAPKTKETDVNIERGRRKEIIKVKPLTQKQRQKLMI